MNEPTREEIVAQIAASEARGDTKIVRLEGKIESMAATLIGKIDSIGDKISVDHEYNRSTRWVMVGLLITCTFALAGVGVAMATYGDALFGRGMNVRDVIQTTIKEVLEQIRK